MAEYKKFKQVNNDYPEHVVLIQGKNSVGAFHESAVLISTIRIGSMKKNYAVVRSFANAEQVLQRRKISYVFLDNNLTPKRQVSFKNNSYNSILGLDTTEIQNMDDFVKGNDNYVVVKYSPSGTECNYHGKSILGHRYFKRYYTKGVVRLSLARIESVLHEHRASYILIDKEDNIIKTVTYDSKLIGEYFGLDIEDSTDAVIVADMKPTVNVTGSRPVIEAGISIADTSVKELADSAPESDSGFEIKDEGFQELSVEENDIVFDYDEAQDYQKQVELEEVDEDEFCDLASVRSIYFTAGFKRFYEKADRRIKSDIDNIIDNFRINDYEQLQTYLKKSTNKPLKGSKWNLEKLYVDNSSGHRLVWCRGEEMMWDGCESDSIVMIEYVTDHDKGQSRAAKKFDPNTELFRAFEKAENEKYDAFEESIPPYKLNRGSGKTVFIPQLTENQRKLVKLASPMMIQGCAGSGKTQVSVEILKTLIIKEQKPIYITFTDQLKGDIRAKIGKMPGLEKVDLSGCVKTVTDFFLDCMDMNQGDINYISREEFVTWKDKRYIHKKDNKYKNIDGDFCWTYIRGVIKGGTESKDDVMPREDFVQWMSKKEGVDGTVSNLIYDINEHANSSLYSDEKALDDNDLADVILNNPELKASVPCIIVDEVQDLTFKQIRAILHCVEHSNVYLCGDSNQRINPTIIDLDSIESLFLARNTELNKAYLGHSFRSGQSLVEFVNHLSELRREYVGNQSLFNEEKETSLRKDEDGLWATICNEKTIDFAEVFAIANEAGNCSIIVPDKETREKIIGNGKNLDDRVYTVQEAKGLEYDIVIIFDFISHKFADFEDIVNKKRKRDTFARVLFNMLYVACTRAKDKLIICESNCPEDIRKLIYKDISVKDSLTNIKGYLDLDQDDEGWLKEAEHLLEERRYKNAIKAYERVSGVDVENDIKKCRLMLDVEEAIGSIDTLDIVEKCAVELIDMEAYDFASQVYNQLKDRYDYVNSYSIYARYMNDEFVSSDDIRMAISEVGNEVTDMEIRNWGPYIEKKLESNGHMLTRMDEIMEKM